VVQKSAKTLAAEYGASAKTVMRQLRMRRVPIRSKVQQRRSEKFFYRYDRGEAITKAWKHGCYETDRYRETRTAEKWIGENHSGQNNAFYGRKHSTLIRSRLSFLARERAIRGSGDYGPDWTAELRESIYQRDGYRCRVCGTDQGSLQVHHIDRDRSNNEKTNLLTLCAACHLAYHGRRERTQEIQAAGDELARMAGSALEATCDKGGDVAHGSQ
jgi:hypothetical protein